MPGNEKDRDWDREMKEVDKLLAKLPDADPTLGRDPVTARHPQGGGGIATVRATPASPGGTRSVAAAWLRLGLGLALGIGMLAWPYSHICGAKLLFYGLGAVTLVRSPSPAYGAPSRRGGTGRALRISSRSCSSFGG